MKRRGMAIGEVIFSSTKCRSSSLNPILLTPTLSHFLLTRMGPPFRKSSHSQSINLCPLWSLLIVLFTLITNWFCWPSLKILIN